MILVTGGAGFIGSNLVAALIESGGHDVVVVDHVGTDGIKWRNLAKHLVDDILPPEMLDVALSRGSLDAVVHMGAVSSTTATDADHVIASNFHLSRRLWEWCAQTKTPFIYASSAATYGEGTSGFSDNTDPAALAALRPLNLYGWSKHWFDRWVIQTVNRGGPTPPQWAGLKFFNVYGPNEAHKGDMMSVVAKNASRFAAGEAVTLFRSHRQGIADGDQKRDFVYVADCVSVMTWLLANPSVNGLFNVGSSAARSFKDLITAGFKAAGQAPAISYIDMPETLRAKYQYFTQADMTRLRDAGFDTPLTPLEVGVTEYLQRYLLTDDPHR